MIKPKLGPKEVVYQNRFQTIFRRLADFGEFRKEYFVTDTGQRVGIVVVGPKGILLTRQYRHLIDGLSWEVPGGRSEPREEHMDAARRECQEETGVLCHNLEPLIYFQPGLDTYYNPTQVFYCRDFSEPESGFVGSSEEVSECQWMPLPACIEMIARRDIQDSLSIISILSYRIFVAAARQ